MAARRELGDIFQAIAEQKRAAAAAGGGAPDLLTRLVTARDAVSGAALSMEAVRDNALLLVFAGHTTTSSTAQWLIASER